MAFDDLLTTYWSQTVLVLVVLGFPIKWYFNLKAKKTEVNHSLFQQNRIIAVRTFFSKYAKAELMWHQIAIYDVLNRKFTTKEMDQLIIPQLNELQEIVLELKIYFDADCHVLFERLTKGIMAIHGKLIDLYFNSNPEKTTTNKAIDYYGVKEEVLQKNRETMEELCLKIKDIFK